MHRPALGLHIVAAALGLCAACTGTSDPADLVLVVTVDADFPEAQAVAARGKLADLVVLDRDIMTVPEAEIAGTRVDLTILDGEVRYERVR